MRPAAGRKPRGQPAAEGRQAWRSVRHIGQDAVPRRCASAVDAWHQAAGPPLGGPEGFYRAVNLLPDLLPDEPKSAVTSPNRPSVPTRKSPAQRHFRHETTSAKSAYSRLITQRPMGDGSCRSRGERTQRRSPPRAADRACLGPALRVARRGLGSHPVGSPRIPRVVCDQLRQLNCDSSPQRREPSSRGHGLRESHATTLHAPE